MGEKANAFRVMRTVVFGFVSVNALIVLCLCVVVMDNGPPESDDEVGVWGVICLLNTCLTLVSLPTMLYFSLNRKGAFASLVKFDVWWTFFLWSFWLVLGAFSLPTPWGFCETPLYWTSYRADQNEQPVCHQSQALSGLVVLNLIALFLYNITLFFLIIRQGRRGNPSAWKAYINEIDFNAKPVPSNTEASFAPQDIAPAAAFVHPTEQHQVSPPQQITSPYLPQHMTSHYPHYPEV